MSGENQPNFRLGVLKGMKKFEEDLELRLQKITKAVMEVLADGDLRNYSADWVCNKLHETGTPESMKRRPTESEVAYILATLAEEKFLLVEKHPKYGPSYYFDGVSNWLKRR